MRTSSVCSVLFLFFLLRSLPLAAHSPSTYWDDRFDLPGLEATIYNAAFDDAGNLYVRGEIGGAGGLPGKARMLMWDGRRWRSIGVPSDTLVVQGKSLLMEENAPLVSLGNKIYTVAENFEFRTRPTHESYLIRWDGDRWSLVGEGVRGNIGALHADATGVYIAGKFTMIGDSAIRGIARWDGVRWHGMGGGTGGSVETLAVDMNGIVYINGYITEAGGTEITTQGARWDGTEWREFGGEGARELRLNRMTASGTTIYAMDRDRIFRLEGDEWKEIGSGLETAYSLATGAFSGDRLGNLYVGAVSRTATEAPNRLLRLSGGAWEELPHRFDGSLLSLAFGPGNTFALLGSFQVVNDTLIAVGAALWDGVMWRAADFGRKYHGLVGSVTAIELAEGYLYAAGKELRTPGLPGTHGILRWSDEKGWEEVGGGIEGAVNRIVRKENGDLLAAGCISRAGGKSVRNIARWDGAEWHPVGEGPDLCPVDLAVAGDTVYAVADKVLMRWDGTGWDHPDKVRSGQLYAVAVGPDGSVYVGGQFDSAGDVRVNNVARWKEGRWFSLDGGMKMRDPSYVPFGFEHLAVHTLAGDGKFIYAGGMFDSAGTTLAFNIARWDGAKWEAMDSGLVGIYPLPFFFNDRAVVRTIRTAGNRIYAAGKFYGAGSWSLYSDDASPRYMGTGGGIAWWDENTGLWNSVGMRSYTTVTGIATDGGQLFIAGDFVRVDDTLRSFRIARRELSADVLERPLVAEALDFGLVPERREEIRDLVITNPASSTRTLTGTVEIIGEPFGTVREAEFRAAPGFSATVPVRFFPAATGFFSGRAIIRHNAAADGMPITVQLSGIGIPLEADFTVEPVTIDFGEVLHRSSSRTDTLVIRNNTNSNSTIAFRLEAYPDVPFALDWEYYDDAGKATTTTTPLAPGEKRRHVIKMTPENVGDFRQTIVLSHDGAPGGEVRIPLHVTVVPRFAQLNVSAARIDFGEVPLEKTVRDTLYVTTDPRSNTGASYRTVQSILPPFLVWQSGNTSIFPGDTGKLIISFLPTQSGAFRDTLRIQRQTNGIIDTISIPIFGKGVEPVLPAPQIELSQSSLDFGSVARNGQKELALTVTNPPGATAPLVISTTPPSSPFSAQRQRDLSLLPGQSTDLRIRFAPTAAGTFTDQLLITHNVEGTPTPLAVPLRGESRTSSVDDVEDAEGKTKGSAVLIAEPNPAAGRTHIRFRAAAAGAARLSIHTTDGREVARLIDGRIEAGERSIEWEAGSVGAGIYLCRLTLGEQEESCLLIVQ